MWWRIIDSFTHLIHFKHLRWRNKVDIENRKKKRIIFKKRWGGEHRHRLQCKLYSSEIALRRQTPMKLKQDADDWIPHGRFAPWNNGLRRWTPLKKGQNTPDTNKIAHWQKTCRIKSLIYSFSFFPRLYTRLGDCRN